MGGYLTQFSYAGVELPNKSFEIKSFADPHPLTPIESYAFKIIGGPRRFPNHSWQPRKELSNNPLQRLDHEHSTRKLFVLTKY